MAANSVVYSRIEHFGANYVKFTGERAMRMENHVLIKKYFKMG